MEEQTMTEKKNTKLGETPLEVQTMGGDYSNAEGVTHPTLTGYGRDRAAYLKNHKNRKDDSALQEELAHVEEYGSKMEQLLIKQMMEIEGLTQETRLTDPHWEGKLNMIRLQVREMVQADLVFS